MTRTGQTNPPVELTRYRITSGERVLRGQRILGVVRITDYPADGHGRAYVVERELTSISEINALLADYVAQATAWDDIPVLPHWIEEAA